MKKVITVDNLLRIRLPKQICTEVGIEEGTEIEISVDKKNIIIKQAKQGKICSECHVTYNSDCTYCNYCGTVLDKVVK